MNKGKWSEERGREDNRSKVSEMKTGSSKLTEDCE